MTTHQNYLEDLGVLVKEFALESKQNVLNDPTDFNLGYMAGFHRMVSLMQQQAEAFSLSNEDIGLSGIDANEDLV